MTEVQEKAIELNQKIIAAQHEIFAANAAHSTLVQRLKELELQIDKMKAWDEQKKRYKLIAPWEDKPALVYALRESFKETETAHWICTKCYDDGHRSILQPKKDHKFIILLFCANCSAEIYTGHRYIGPADYVAD